MADGSNALHASLHSLEAAGGVYSQIATGLLTNQFGSMGGGGGGLASGSAIGACSSISDRGDMPSNSLMQSVHQGLAVANSTKSSILAGSRVAFGSSRQSPAHNASQFGASMFGAPPPNLKQDLRRLGLEHTAAAADMSLSALYLHEIHHRSCQNSSSVSGVNRGREHQVPSHARAASTGGGQMSMLPPRLKSPSFREDEEEEEQPLVDVSDNQRV